MHTFFNAGCIAVIGVSPRPGNLGQKIVQNLHEFSYNGVIELVGQRGGTFHGHYIHQSVAEIARPIDLAVIFTPARIVPGMMEECARAGIKRIVIESGGFAEKDQDGAKLAERIRAIAAENDIRFVGPNGIGTFNTHSGLCVSFSYMPMVRPGGISIVTQSGGVGISYLSEFANEHLGVAKFASIGNKMSVDEVDLLEYLIDDPETKQIVFYLESFSRAREFCRLVGSTDKPVVVHKSNTGELSGAIAASHTTAMLSDDHVAEEALRQMGVLRTRTLHGAVSGAKIFSLPPLRGTRIGVISRSGGHAVIAADTCARHGFTLPPFDDHVLQVVSEHVRAGVIRLQNPLDLGDLFEIEAYKAVLSDILAQPQIDGVVFLLAYFSAANTQAPIDLLRHLAEQCERHQKPVAMVLHAWPEEIVRMKSLAIFPIFATADEAVDALAVSLVHHRRLDRRREPPPRLRVDRARADELLVASRGKTHLGVEAYDVCRAYGLPVIDTRFAPTAQKAAAAARELGCPAALKVESPDASHKTDVGGVALKLSNGRGVREAFERVRASLAKHRPGARFDGVVVQPMVRGGLELIVGAARDRDFGPLVALGWGGIAAEVLGKPVTRLAPISRAEALRMIAKLPAAGILEAMRGRAAFDVAALADIVVRVGLMIANHDALRELDLNPVRLFERGKGAAILDVRMIPEG